MAVAEHLEIVEQPSRKRERGDGAPVRECDEGKNPILQLFEPVRRDGKKTDYQCIICSSWSPPADEKAKAKGKLCSCSGYTNLRDHLQRVHKIVLCSSSESKNSSSNLSDGMSATSVVRKKELSPYLLGFVIRGLRPFSVVEDEPMINLLERLGVKDESVI